MANNTSQQMAVLAMDATFQRRISILLVLEAMVVLRELSSVTSHTARAALARAIVFSPDSYAGTLTRELVSDTNLIGVAIVTNSDGSLDSSANDAAIRSQIATNWNAWAVIA